MAHEREIENYIARNKQELWEQSFKLFGLPGAVLASCAYEGVMSWARARIAFQGVSGLTAENWVKGYSLRINGDGRPAANAQDARDRAYGDLSYDPATGTEPHRYHNANLQTKYSTGLGCELQFITDNSRLNTSFTGHAAAYTEGWCQENLKMATAYPELEAWLRKSTNFPLIQRSQPVAAL